MPGIASDRSPGVQIGPITSIGEAPATPAVSDFMDAFRSGFITPDDIQRRAQQGRLANDNELTQLQAGDIQRKLAPGAAQNALDAQALTADQIQASRKVLPGQTDLTLGQQAATKLEQDRAAQLASDNADVHSQAVEDATKRRYIDIFGHKPPSSFDLPNPQPAEPFDAWFQREKVPDIEKKVNDFEPGVPDPKDLEKIIQDKVNNFRPGEDTPEANTARAAYANMLEQSAAQQPTADQLRAQYEQKLIADTKSSPAVLAEHARFNAERQSAVDKIREGSPEYAVALNQRVQDAQDAAALRAAKLQAVPKVIEEQAKAAAGTEGPSKMTEFAAKLRAEISTDAGMKTLGEENKFATRILNLTEQPNPSNAEALAALEGYVKLLDPNAVIRQGKLVITQEMTPKVQQVGKLLNRLSSSTGGFLNASDIEQLRKTTEEIQSATNREAQQFLKVRAHEAIDNGIALDSVFTPDQQAILGGNMSPAQVSKPGPGAKPPVGASLVVPTSGPYKGKTLRWVGPNPTDYTVVQ